MAASRHFTDILADGEVPLALNRPDQRQRGRFLQQRDESRAHAACRAGDNHFNHQINPYSFITRASFSRDSEAIEQRGKRNSPSIFPIMASAVLTGMGLVS